MVLSNEQKEIIRSKGNIKINAIAGSGKTTTIIEYAKTRPQNSRILYLAFNRSVKIEAQKKFSEQGLHHVIIETAHSLAYRHVVRTHGYTVRNRSYNSLELVQLLKLKSTGEKHSEFILANHIEKYAALFCNSSALKVQDVNYKETITDQKALAFVHGNFDTILHQTRVFLAKMNNKEIEITHDFYLKKFQLLSPTLPFDYILFDEGQDASATMLDIFVKQPAIKVIVGDTHQQIYGWRNAVNSLDKVPFTIYFLTNSFRFGNSIATLAKNILSWKEHISAYLPVEINGKGESDYSKSKAIIARTNLGLLLKAIEYVTEKKNLKHIYFEGNISSYTYADEGASLYDILNLSQENRHLIRDPLIKMMKSVEDLEEYIDKTDDSQLGMMLEIVNEYGTEIPHILNTIKEKHVSDQDKSKAQFIFSTVHRCKGMEYDSVHLVNDFASEEKIQKMASDAGKDPLLLSKLNEEINLLYVAITRTKNTLYIPETLIPKNHIMVPNIHVLVVEKTEKQKTEKSSTTKSSIKEYPKPIRSNSSGAYMPWSEDMDQELIKLFDKGISVPDLAQKFGRTKGAIYARMKKLSLVD